MAPHKKSRALPFFVLVLTASLPLAAAPSRPQQAPTIGWMNRTGGPVGRVSLAQRALAPKTIPVVIQLDHEATSADLAMLEGAGASIARDDRGSVLGRGRIITAELPAGSSANLATLPGVSKVTLDGPLLVPPRPLDGTTELTGAQATWRVHTEDGIPLDGTGITICDVDSGIDPFHPLFFRADGGVFDWIDEDGDGKFELGVDSVDLGDGPIVVRALNGIVTNYWDPDTPLFGTEDPTYDPKFDFLYADEDDSGEREVGPDAGFTEDTPTYGERLLVVDDVDRNGHLDPGEKLVALGTSKIKAFRVGSKVYRRGQNLIAAPWDDAMEHGVGASGVLAGGVPGLTGLAGMAPGAELVMATDTMGGREVQMTQFCISEGARVVLHEYAPWTGYHLDGSSALETLIDSSNAEGIVHVNPAGNLSTSEKLYKHTVSSGAVTNIPIQIPDIGINYLGASLLWRDVDRDLQIVLSGGGVSLTLDTSTVGSVQDWIPGVVLYSFREDSDRGTARVDLYLVRDQTGGVPVPPGDYTLTVTDPSPPDAPDLELIGYVFDEVSGWGHGAYFTEFSSEDHLIGYPGTADHGMPIAAFTGHAWNGTDVAGQRAFYSGRGYRIDGEKIMWIAGPDNPITSAHFEGQPLSYLVYGGTSGASPHVAGASALILQNDPSLDGDAVKEKLKAGAVSDEFTGDLPNDDFGWGKLDVYRSIFGTDRPGGGPPTIGVDAVTMVVGDATVPIDVADPDEPASELTIEADRDYDGVYDETLSGAELPVSYDAPGHHWVKLRVTDSTGRTSAALAEITVTDPPPDGEDDDDDGDGDGSFVFGPRGGGCAIGTSDYAGGSFAALALALAFLSGSRRSGARSSSKRAVGRGSERTGTGSRES